MEKKRKLEAEIVELRERLAGIKDEWVGYGDAKKPMEVQRQRVQIQREIETKEVAIQNLPQMQTGAEAGFLKQRSEAEERIRKAQEEMEARADRRNMDMQAKRDRAEWNKRLAEARIESNAVGRNPTEITKNRFEAARQQFEQDRRIVQSPGRLYTPDQKEDAALRARQALVQMEKAAKDLIEEKLALRKEEKQLLIDENKELQKSLLMAGPGDMLKQLAAYRLAKRGAGNSIGSLMAMDPSMRESVMKYSGKSPERMEIKERQNQVKGVDENWLQTTMRQIQSMGSQLAASVKASGLNTLNESATQTAASLTGLQTAASGAQTALQGFPSIIATIEAAAASVAAAAANASAAAPAAALAPTGQFAGVLPGITSFANVGRSGW